jgi:TrmH family RNA methyltransferase
MPREILSHSNALIKRIKSLRDKKYRRQEQMFLAEGLRILTEAAEAGRLPRYLVYATEAASHPLVRQLTSATENAGGEVIATSRDILHKLSGKDNPQAVLGVYDIRTESLDDIDRTRAPIWFVAQSMRDPGNLGTLLRTGDAVGAGGVILVDDCCDPFSVEAVRASMGALFTQQIVNASWQGFIGWLRSGPGQLVGTSLRTEIDYQQPDYAAPVFILIGNEQAGLPDDYETACDLLVKIPMRGKADSLNASVAAAVMAYEVLNQQRR